MIPVVLAPEPTAPGFDFDVEVRQRGIRSLIDKGLPRQGPLPRGTKLPNHWTRCMQQLHIAYDGFCAFLAVRIPLVVGDSTVEHFKPKSLYAEHAYEWSNYRLVCGILNSCKGNYEDVLDPCGIAEGTFQLTPSLEVVPGAGLDAQTRVQAEQTITRLKLNGPDRKQYRTQLWTKYLRGRIAAEELREESPFIANEMVRLKRMDPNATGSLPVQ